MSFAALAIPLALVVGQIEDGLTVVPDPELARIHGTRPASDYRMLRPIIDDAMRADNFVSADLLRTQTDGWVNWMGSQVRGGL
jgi:hypothetical protein